MDLLFAEMQLLCRMSAPGVLLYRAAPRPIIHNIMSLIYEPVTAYSCHGQAYFCRILIDNLRLPLGYDPLHKFWQATWLVSHAPQQWYVDNVHHAHVQGGVDSKQRKDDTGHNHR